MTTPIAIEPLTPPDCDLRHYVTMPLDVGRLRDSAMAHHENPEVFRAAVLLWAASWHQLPAASLPNADRELCRIAGFGRSIDAWLAVREAALHGFELCADGRLYHRVVAEYALIAWEKRKKYVARASLGGKARMAASGKSASSTPRASPKREEKTGEDKTGKDKRGRAAPNGAGDASPPAPLRPALATRLSPAWFVDETDRAYAVEKGLSPEEITAQEDAFRDYWWARSGQIARKLDWHATWRTWVRRHLEDRDGRRSGAGGGGRLNGASRVGNVLHGIVEARRIRRGQPSGD